MHSALEIIHIRYFMARVMNLEVLQIYDIVISLPHLRRPKVLTQHYGHLKALSNISSLVNLVSGIYCDRVKDRIMIVILFDGIYSLSISDLTRIYLTLLKDVSFASLRISCGYFLHLSLTLHIPYVISVRSSIFISLIFSRLFHMSREDICCNLSYLL